MTKSDSTSAPVLGVVLIEQRYEDVAVKEGKHALYAKFIPELVDQLVGDDGAARGDWLEAIELSVVPTWARVLHSLA